MHDDASKPETTTHRPTGEEVARRTVTHAEIKSFGELTGDRSEIHFDPEAGRRAGYGGPIAHGLLTACWAAGAIPEDGSSDADAPAEEFLPSDFSIRLASVVRSDDRFGVRFGTPTEAPSPTAPSGGSRRRRAVAFETRNQRGETTSTGEFGWRPAAHRGPSDRRRQRAAPRGLSPRPIDRERTYFAEDLVECGPRGRLPARRLDRALVAAFTRHVAPPVPATGEAAGSVPAGPPSPFVVPMLVFSLGFADFLTEMLRAPLPSAGFAGHLGDEWTLYEPVAPGDQLRTTHAPIDCRPSRSHPGMGIVRFGLSIANQRDRVVMDGVVTMMIPSRAAGSTKSR